MSYACRRDNWNVFFEPADLDWMINVWPGSTRGRRESVSASAAGAAGVKASSAARPVAGQRLAVSGLITPTTGTGAIGRVETLGMNDSS